MRTIEHVHERSATINVSAMDLSSSIANRSLHKRKRLSSAQPTGHSRSSASWRRVIVEHRHGHPRCDIGDRVVPLHLLGDSESIRRQRGRLWRPDVRLRSSSQQPLVVDRGSACEPAGWSAVRDRVSRNLLCQVLAGGEWPTSGDAHDRFLQLHRGDGGNLVCLVAMVRRATSLSLLPSHPRLQPGDVRHGRHAYRPETIDQARRVWGRYGGCRRIGHDAIRRSTAGLVRD